MTTGNLTDAQYVVLDIETDGLLPEVSKIFCAVCMAYPSGIVRRFFGASVYDGSLVDFIKGKVVIGHNVLSFDLPCLSLLLGYKHPINAVVDTLILSQIESPDREGGNSLAAWGNRLGFPKQPSPDFTKYSDEMLGYCENDVRLTYRLYQTLLDLTSKFSPESIQRELLFRYLIDQQIRKGFYFDIPYATDFLIRMQSNVDNLELELQESFSPTIVEMKTKTKTIPFNPGSRQQIAERLMAKGWKPTQFTPTGQPIVSETILDTLTDIPEAAILKNYFVCQKIVSFLTNWMAAVKPDTSRIHGDIRTLGAVTTRCTHNSPNVAQTPSARSPYGKECRTCWTIEDKVNYRLLGCDASGLELRVLAHYMNDSSYTKEVIEGDVHTANKLAAGLETRDMAKTFIYALLYGAGPEKIGSIVGRGAKQGKELKDKFLKNIPALGKLINNISDAVDRTGKLKGLDGRYFNIRSKHAALNVLIQGGGAIICKEWLIQIMKEVYKLKLDARPVANIHDEIQFEVHKDHAEELGMITKEAMKSVETVLNVRCPLGSEYKVGLSWADTH